MRYPPVSAQISASYNEATAGEYALYECSASLTLTLISPAKRNRKWIANTGSGTVTVATAGTSATIDGGSTITIPPGTCFQLVANGLRDASAAWRTVNALSVSVVPGTATGGKVLITDSNNDIAGIRNESLTGTLTPAGGIVAAGGFSANPRGLWIGQTAPQVAGDFNNSTPSITETYVSEIFIPCNMTVTGVALFNGSDVTGNVTVGLATSAGAVIAAAKSASTAGSGTDAIQLIPFATPYAAVGPANYFIQVQYSSATARYNTHVLGKHAVLVQTAQTYGTLTPFTAPTAFVTAVGNVGGLY